MRDHGGGPEAGGAAVIGIVAIGDESADAVLVGDGLDYRRIGDVSGGDARSSGAAVGLDEVVREKEAARHGEARFDAVFRVALEATAACPVVAIDTAGDVEVQQTETVDESIFADTAGHGCAGADQPQHAAFYLQISVNGATPLRRDHVDGATDGVGTVEGGSGAAQDFDVIDIDDVEGGQKATGIALDGGGVTHAQAINEDRSGVGAKAAHAH